MATIMPAHIPDAHWCFAEVSCQRIVIKQATIFVMSEALPTVMTVEQAGNYLQLSSSEVEELLRQGVLPGLKLGSTWRVLRDVLDQFLTGSPAPEQAKPNEGKGSSNTVLELPKVALVTSERGRSYRLEELVGIVTFLDKSSLPKGRGILKFGDVCTFDVDEKGTIAPSSVTKVLDGGDSQRFLIRRFEEAEIYQSAQVLYCALLVKFPKISNFVMAIDFELGHKNLDLALVLCNLAIEKKGNSSQINDIYTRKASILADQKHYFEAIRLLEARLEASDTTESQVYSSLVSILTHHGTMHSLRKAEEYVNFLKERSISIPTDKLNQRIKFSIDSPIGRRTSEILEKMGFRFDIMRTAETYSDILIEPLQGAGHEIYNINNKSMARVFNHSGIYEYELERLLSDLQTHIYKESNFNVAFVFARNINKSNLIFKKIRSGNYEVLIPIDIDEWRDKSLEATNSDLDLLFKAWLNERDFFQDHAPVGGRFYFGRDKVENTVSGLINHGKHVGILGLRKSGKTSFLKQIQEKRYRDIVVYIDLQSVIKDRSMDYIYWSIANQIRMEIESNRIISAKNVREGLKLGRYSDFLSVPQNSGTILMLNHDIMYVIDLLDARGYEESKIIILVDELEIMLPVGHGYSGFPDYDSFFSYIRGVSQASGGRLVTVMAAANALISELHTLNQRDNPVFQFYENIFLPPLSQEESAEMISSLARMMSKAFSDDALSEIYTECGGHPFITRQFCSFLLNERKGLTEVSSTTVAASVKRFVEVKHDIFDEILSRLERYFPEEKDVVISIIKGNGSERSIARATGRKNVSKELKNLEGYHIVEKINGNYRVKISLLRRWMKQVGEA